MLGNGAHPDPARELAEAIVRAREKAEETGGYLSTVVSIVGTDLDPQGLPSQRKTLERAGAIIAPSNASASELAAMIVRSGQRAR
jgi:FdrA protein